MRALSGLILFSLLAPVLAAQQAQPPAVYAPRDGGVSEVLQSIYIPPLVNAPFTAVVHTEWAKPLADGGSITVVNQRRIARDSQGRIYEERWLLMPRGSEHPSRMNVIQIADPNAHTLLNCYTLRQPRTCVLERFAEAVVTSFKPPVAASGPLANNAGSRAHEDLGNQQLEGILTAGTRDSTTFNAGAVGNDRQFTVTREFWQAPSLGINLLSVLDDPRIGKQTFTITDVHLGEPEASLFELPEGFTVSDRRSPVSAER